MQIWIFPEENNLEPGYEQAAFGRADKLNRLRLIASRDGRDGSLSIHQDVNLYASVLERGQRVALDSVQQRRLFVQVVSGDIEVNGAALTAGDGAQLRDTGHVDIVAVNDAEFLVFDLA